MTLTRHLRRRLVIAPVLVAHAAVLALVIAGGSGDAGKAALARPVVLLDIAPTAPRVRVPHTSQPALQKAAVISLTEPEPIVLQTTPPDAVLMPTVSDAALAPGETCDVAGRLRATLRDDPRTRAALGMLPRDARSVANAVMLWDGRWIAGTTTSTRYALDQIRAAVVATVAAAPAACRQEDQTGPTLLLVAGSPDTVLALGSGHWRWTDLFAADVHAPTTVASRADGAPSPAT